MSERIAQAMARVRRSCFLPRASAAEAEANVPVVTRRAPDGTPTSSSTMPSLMATMLDQLDLGPGMRVLEVGSGTGYNAALLAELVGPSGSVTTVDIQPDVVAEARAALDRTGFDRVVTRTGDGSLGAVDIAPFDRIIVTAGAWDLPPAWFAQLRTGGRLVVPLRWRGQAQSVAFRRAADHLRSGSLRTCGFMPMVGHAGEHEVALDVAGPVTLTWDDDQVVDPGRVAAALAGPAYAVGSGVTIGAEEPIAALWLRLTVAETGTGRIAAGPAAVDSGLCRPAVPARCPVLVEDGSLAYLAVHRRSAPVDPVVELGAVGHGTRGRELADRLVAQVHAWGTDRTAVPEVVAWPGGPPAPPGSDRRVIPKPSATLVLGY